MEIVSTDASRTVGKGVYLTRIAGLPEPRQRPFTFEGTTILEPQLKPAPTLDSRYTEDLGSYAGDVAKRRAAEATPESTFEDEWTNARLAEVMETRAALDAEEPRPRLTTAELAEYAQPDPYAADLKALQARDARALAAKEAR